MRNFHAYTLYNCMLVYLTPAGRRVHFRAKVVAQNPEGASALAEKLLYTDKRRMVANIVHREVIEYA